MPHRYTESYRLFPSLKLTPCLAIRQKFREGYSLSDLKSDVMAGMIVGLVAIPLSMALAIASGVAPQNGLYTVIVGGMVVALLGGSRCQVTGPTAAFVVILAPIAQKFGFSGLLVAGLMAGVLLLLMGLARLGRLIEFIPYPVTTGFTAGIAVVIGTIQLKDFFGLHVEHMPENYLGRVVALARAFPTFSRVEFGIGAFTLFLLVIWPKLNKKIPAPLVAMTAAGLATIILKKLFPYLEFATIGNQFSTAVNGVTIHGIPPTPPLFALPWFSIDSWATVEALVPSAFAIAMLGAIESLLSAVVADGMAQTHHDPDTELVALGVGNILCPFFGGIAATGAIARTATNIRFGAKSPLSAVVHSLFTLVVVLVFAKVVSYLPMAALAALLLLVAYNMSEYKHFIHIVKVSPRSDVLVLLLCFGLTVVFDMVIGVTVGVVLAALLFMRRMAALTSGRLVSERTSVSGTEDLPKNVLLYEIAGPLFFGAANTATRAIETVAEGIQIIIFNIEKVPVMDITGLVALESAIKRLCAKNKIPVLTGIQQQPLQLIQKSGLITANPGVRIFSSLDEALRWVKSSDSANAQPPTQRIHS